MTKKEFIVDQLRSMLKEIKVDDQVLYDIVHKNLVKTEHHVIIEIKHRDTEIASISYNKLTATITVDVYGRSEGYTWGDDIEIENYNDEVLKDEKVIIKRAILNIALQSTEVVMANRNELKLGTIDM